MDKSIDTLVEDIYRLFEDDPHDPSDENLDHFASQMRGTIKRRLKELRDERPYLRMSSIGRCIRANWYDINDPTDPVKLTPANKIKFLFGDMIEVLLMFLIRESGHKIEREQEEVNVDGVIGHTDGMIDGHVADIKSASSWAFKNKFVGEGIFDEDGFGYLPQLSGYRKGLTGDRNDAYFLVMDKQLGKIALIRVPDMMMPNIEDLIKKVKEAVALPEPPKRPHYAIPEGKSGNLKLPVACAYCKHSFKCWSDANDGKGIRTFIYSRGPVFLVEVIKEPNVPEAEDGKRVAEEL